VGNFTSMLEEDSSELLFDSYLGKLKLYRPSLYFKLSSWERDLLDKTFPSFFFSLSETTSTSKSALDLGGLILGGDRVTEVLLPDNPTTTLPESSTTRFGGAPEISAQLLSTESENAQLPDMELKALIPTLNESVIPIPLQTFWGLEAYQGST